jgi:hypothetical protein
LSSEPCSGGAFALLWSIPRITARPRVILQEAEHHLVATSGRKNMPRPRPHRGSRHAPHTVGLRVHERQAHAHAVLAVGSSLLATLPIWRPLTRGQQRAGTRAPTLPRAARPGIHRAELNVRLPALDVVESCRTPVTSTVPLYARLRRRARPGRPG